MFVEINDNLFRSMIIFLAYLEEILSSVWFICSKTKIYAEAWVKSTKESVEAFPPEPGRGRASRSQQFL
jgi:hypothetical protein